MVGFGLFVVIDIATSAVVNGVGVTDALLLPATGSVGFDAVRVAVLV